MVYIFDIDGTIADLEHRLHFIQDNPANWPAFFAACGADSPIPEVIEIAVALHLRGHFLALITGRSIACEPQTHSWMSKFGMPFDAIYMRKEGDHREDNVVKGELLDAFQADSSIPKIHGVFEDRQQVVDMYRARGIRVFQVAPGNF